jgi:signal transduction histidine kinase
MRLADFIEQNLSLILAAWEDFAASLFPAAAQPSPATLRNHAEQILLAIVQDLKTAQSPAEQLAKSLGQQPHSLGAPNTAAQTHAVLRAGSGFTMQQLVAEYRALRASVLRSWLDTRAPDAEMVEDIGRFNEAVDQAIAESVDFFSREAERWRNVFLGVLGHDLRGPLNAILLTSQLVSRLSDGTPASEPTARLIRSGERMKELLDDLLDYSRTSLELGIPVSPVPVELASSCREEVELQRQALPGCPIEFEADGATYGVWDASRIKQVIGNLVTNAARYGYPGRPVVVKLSGEAAGVRLSVSNEGPTIPQEAIQLLFEPLRRGPARNVQGERTSMGLGLFIVRQVAHAHGGRVSVDSADGRTVFTVVLPKTAAPQG